MTTSQTKESPAGGTKDASKGSTDSKDSKDSKQTTSGVEMRTLGGGKLGEEVKICSILNGMWQVSGGHGKIDAEKAVKEMSTYVKAGLNAFDLADIYGPAELFVGAFHEAWMAEHKTPVPGLFFTKWVPRPQAWTKSMVDAAIAKSLERMKCKSLDMLQFHWWDYENDAYLDTLQHLHSIQKEGKIKMLALTNFDTIRLKEILEAGIPIVSNQVQFSMLDRRPLNEMTKVCEKYGTKLLAYGSILGGFLSEKWLDKPEPKKSDLKTASLGKYLNTIGQWSKGDWKRFQELLKVIDGIAKEHKVDIAAVGVRWVLDQPCVAGVIVGTRLSVAQHIESTLKVFSLKLTDQNRTAIDTVLKKGAMLPGDCGDEYRG